MRFKVLEAAKTEEKKKAITEKFNGKLTVLTEDELDTVVGGTGILYQAKVRIAKPF